MGSSNDANIKSLDASVGGLVWVRRRNGSWWPGRILDLNEVSEGCLVPPKSGTPVKLLGREDASIDWYNLEKSKRVKAFRCGEYNECIEKAKSAAANSSKKAVKYARREDAILHALELESICLGQNCLNFGYRKDISDGEIESLARESSSISNCDEADDEMADISLAENRSGLGLELSQTGSSFEDSFRIHSGNVQSKQSLRRTPIDSEDDGMEGVKRMRGLQDLSAQRVANGKVHAEGQLELVQQDDTSPYNSNTGNVSKEKVSNGSKLHSSLKRKRSQVPIVHEFLKRKYRRRTLMKVLESTAMVSVPVICDEFPNLSGSPLLSLHDCRLSALGSNALKESSSIEIISTRVSHDNGVSSNDAEAVKTKDYKIASLSDFADIELLSGKLFDVPLVGEDDHSLGFSPLLVSCTSMKSFMGASPRQASQSEDEILRTDEMNESGYTSVSGACRNNLNQRIEKGSSKWQSKRKRNLRQISGKRIQVSTKYVGMADESTVVAKDEIEGDPCMRETRANSSSEVSLTRQRLLPQQLQHRPLARSRNSMQAFDGNIDSPTSLYDVKLEVRASSRPQHVPLVSLMSKLNGKAIVGHPLAVEILEDGQCNSFFSRTETDIEDDENGLQSKQLAFQPHNSPGKSPKTKRSGQLSKKIRKLSTLTGCKQHENEQKPFVEKLKGAVIACIPLKVVFSHINEAVNGTTRPTCGALSSSYS